MLAVVRGGRWVEDTEAATGVRRAGHCDGRRGHQAGASESGFSFSSAQSLHLTSCTCKPNNCCTAQANEWRKGGRASLGPAAAGARRCFLQSASTASSEDSGH